MSGAADPAGFWPGCGWSALGAGEGGALLPTPAFWRTVLARPELAPVEESCQSERALHAALLDDPLRAVPPERLARLQDTDARDNYGVFLAFRERLQAAGSVQACYRGLFAASGPVPVAPVFVDLLAQLVLRQLQDDVNDAFQARAAEMLFRTQRVTQHDGRVLAGDRDTLDQRHATAGLGELGRLLQQAGAPLKALDIPVLAPDNAADYWRDGDRHRFLLDLTHELRRDVGHGVQFTLTNAHSGLQALSRVLERWVLHLLGVQVRVQPVQQIDDAHWRWHLGLDAEATALLNDLYEDRPVDDERRRRLLSLFRLDFADAAEMRADVAGRPVYLGMATTADGLLRLKPQNLLLNLPLRTAV